MNLELALKVVRKAIQKQKTFAFAESCTGGFLSSMITDIEGSSLAFKGSIICYTEEVKLQLLHIKNETLLKHSVYSHECAKEMAINIREIMNVDYAISLTGEAGENKGRVFIGYSSYKTFGSKEFNFSGDRLTHKKEFADAALKILSDLLEDLL